MSFKISVIMPIYNAEKNLKKSINSIIQQTIGFENIELILVDDKSTDNSRSIIEHFSTKFQNITPIFLENNSGGASIPRNYGMKKSTSEYIMFIDSDDEYSEDLCEKFYKCISSHDVDLVSCNYNTIDHIHTSKIEFVIPFENKQESSYAIIATGDIQSSIIKEYVDINYKKVCTRNSCVLYKFKKSNHSNSINN